ncbi:uncharacterized protein LOC129538636 [Moschus berezovskii]|uniref:uncharacterized protein LOC129538636 n=1 Tax=Moschus berezovskii TaxID=68408 RepID=UPI00244464A3|nr:uncharacterized protein LOC129538636 [Moschus berezovskii]
MVPSRPPLPAECGGEAAGLGLPGVRRAPPRAPTPGGAPRAAHRDPQPGAPAPRRVLSSARARPGRGPCTAARCKLSEGGSGRRGAGSGLGPGGGPSAQPGGDRSPPAAQVDRAGPGRRGRDCMCPATFLVIQRADCLDCLMNWGLSYLICTMASSPLRKKDGRLAKWALQSRDLFMEAAAREYQEDRHGAITAATQLPCRLRGDKDAYPELSWGWVVPLHPQVDGEREGRSHSFLSAACRRGRRAAGGNWDPGGEEGHVAPLIVRVSSVQFSVQFSRDPREKP